MKKMFLTIALFAVCLLCYGQTYIMDTYLKDTKKHGCVQKLRNNKPVVNINIYGYPTLESIEKNPEIRIVIPFEYDKCCYIEDLNLVFAKLGDKWGIIDTNNNTVVPFVYERIMIYGMGVGFGSYREIDRYDFSLIPVKENNGKWGYLSAETFELAIPHILDDCRYFKKNDSTAKVSFNGVETIINRKGEIDEEYPQQQQLMKQERAENERQSLLQRMERLKSAKTGHRLIGTKQVAQKGSFFNQGAQPDRFAMRCEIVTWNEDRSRVYLRLTNAQASYSGDLSNFGAGSEKKSIYRDGAERYPSQNYHFWVNPFDDDEGWTWNVE